MFEEMTNASVLSENKTPLHAYLFYSLIFDFSNYSSFSVVFQKRSKEKKSYLLKLNCYITSRGYFSEPFMTFNYLPCLYTLKWDVNYGLSWFLAAFTHVTFLKRTQPKKLSSNILNIQIKIWIFAGYIKNQNKMLSYLQVSQILIWMVIILDARFLYWVCFTLFI